MNSIPASVLVIEPHPLMREALCAAIADEPELRVSLQTTNAIDALRMAKVLIPDVILLALGNVEPALGELDQLHKELPEVPILALTLNESFGEERAALEHGAQVVLTKSMHRSELIRTLLQMRVQVFARYEGRYTL